MSLTRSQVEHVARLARLQLTEEECEAFTLQLNDILKFVEQLNTLNTEGIEPTAHAIPVSNVFRPDRVCPSLDPELALANAPDRVNYYFRVPKILEDDES
ncbi:MAG TPA: Asp-tRNA(Asn)/Glu-tRNA(Gln) amidotransferase subunit GatC [Bacillota bacterium]|nr:Asp-tRNA(Asn)/Glu-tRNA(Gln) amidotransferase subunit GatC [Bacillota bacterium]HPT87747.1 Asp-tRNA(Asn)/Glu-tRNA(Gln) amidotransferase subunit GatC [Bacillota bacterium]